MAATESALTYEELSAKAESELRALEEEAAECCRRAGSAAVAGRGPALAEVLFISGEADPAGSPFSDEAEAAFASSLRALGFPDGWYRTTTASRCLEAGNCREECPFPGLEAELVSPKLLVLAGPAAAKAVGLPGLELYRPQAVASDRIALLTASMGSVLADEEEKKRFWGAFKEAEAMAGEAGLG